jgi:hypothetical protein
MLFRKLCQYLDINKRPASVRWLLLISAYEVDLLQLQLAQGFAGMPRVAGTVRSIILCVRNLSTADVLMTINIIQKPAFYGWLQRQLPPTSRILDYGYYKPTQQKKQLIRYNYYSTKIVSLYTFEKRCILKPEISIHYTRYKATSPEGLATKASASHLQNTGLTKL